MDVAFRLIPREERFYDDFTAMAEQIRKGAELLDAMLAPDKPLWDKADEIKEVEHKCDFLTHEIIQRLNRTFVTPLDREDIHTLARSLDDVMMIGIGAVAGSARSAWQTSRPSIPGSIRSSIKRSGALSLALGSAAVPDATISAVWPAFCR